MIETNSPGDFNSNGNLIRALPGQVIARPDAVELLPLAEGTYDAYMAASEAEDAPNRDVGDVVSGNYSRIRNNPFEPEDNADAFATTESDSIPWEVGINAQTGAAYSHEAEPFMCIQAHTTQSDWYPGAPGLDALWVRMVGALEAWAYPVQYEVGDRCLYDGSDGPETIWVCTQANLSNVTWYPGGPANLWEEEATP